MAKQSKTFNFDEAYDELQNILESIQEEGSIEKLEAQIKRASELLSACKTKLRTIESTIEKTLNE